MGIKYEASNQNIIVRGNPTTTKSLNLYSPGAYTIRFVWYPIGVIKLAEAPKQTAIRNALVGSITSTDEILIKWLAKSIAKGVRIIATAAFEINAEIINVTAYNIDITALACI